MPLSTLGEANDDKNVGDAIQLQLAAFTAFSRAKGKGKGKPKGKGKVIISNLSIEQRRKRLAEAPRLDPSPLSDERFAELGAIEAQQNPESIFAIQHLARQEAQKAFVDTGRYTMEPHL